jgi:hypothetical protein
MLGRAAAGLLALAAAAVFTVGAALEAAPDCPKLGGNFSGQPVPIEGLQGRALLYVPPGANTTSPLPIIVSLHAAGKDPMSALDPLLQAAQENGATKQHMHACDPSALGALGALCRRRLAEPAMPSRQHPLTTPSPAWQGSCC